jgi:large subunit ribosomal protein L25
MADDTTKLEVAAREETGSRAMRRLRRAGRVPGVLYGGNDGPVPFDVDARTFRNALAHSGAVIEVTLGSDKAQPVVVKDVQRHPVRGEILHADLLRIDLNVAIHATVVVELTGAEDAPGVSEGGVLSQDARELNIEALPGDIPDVITVDVSGMAMNDTLTLTAVTAPQGVTLLDDPETTVIATITPPTAEPVEDEIETETELVGEGDAEAAEAQAEGDTSAEAEQAGGGDAE